MSYHRKGPGLGIGQGIGTQAMADISEYLLVPPPPPPPPPKTVRRARQALFQPTGACCSGCAKGAGCGAHDALGAVTVAGMLRPLLTGGTPAPTAPPIAPSSGTSPIVKLVVLAGIAVGGVFAYRKIKNRLAQKK